MDDKISFNWTDVITDISQQVADISSQKALLQAQVKGLLKERSELVSENESLRKQLDTQTTEKTEA